MYQINLLLVDSVLGLFCQILGLVNEVLCRILRLIYEVAGRILGFLSHILGLVNKVAGAFLGFPGKVFSLILSSLCNIVNRITYFLNTFVKVRLLSLCACCLIVNGYVFRRLLS